MQLLWDVDVIHEGEDEDLVMRMLRGVVVRIDSTYEWVAVEKDGKAVERFDGDGRLEGDTHVIMNESRVEILNLRDAEAKSVLLALRPPSKEA